MCKLFNIRLVFFVEVGFCHSFSFQFLRHFEVAPTATDDQRVTSNLLNGAPWSPGLFSLCFAGGWGAALFFRSPGYWFLGKRAHKYSGGVPESLVKSDWPTSILLLGKQQQPGSKQWHLWYAAGLACSWTRWPTILPLREKWTLHRV